MFSLRDLYKKQMGFLQGWKGSGFINNLLNAKKLQHNRPLYKKYGVEKSIYAPIGSKDFNYSLAGEIPWLDMPGIGGSLSQNADFQSFDEHTQIAIRNFIEHGFLVLRGFYSEKKVAELNAELDRLLAERKTPFNGAGRKIMNAHRYSPAIDTCFKNDKLLKLLDFIMGKKVIPFQTISSISGIEQRPHSDSIHLTTQPPGYLITCWTALEDVHADNGPLFYFPGSHRLPYLTSQDYGAGNSKFFIGENCYHKYENKVEEVIQENGLKKSHFQAKKGDVLLWHANLLHGSEPVTESGATTRRSMMAHYFCEGVICYHEISQQPALLENGN